MFSKARPYNSSPPILPCFKTWWRCSGKKEILTLISCLIVCLSPNALPGEEEDAKAELTPTFWQRDPDADFEDEGRMHCAPVAISDGLIYLAQAFDFTDLVPGTDHESQIALVTELAEEFQTDPSIGGTSPDKIMTGLQSYVEGKGHTFERLEIMTWRDLSAANKEFSLGKKPGLSWMRKAARSKNTVVIFNFGWYVSGDEGFVRKGGHWVAVVGADTEEDEFYVHNPALPSDDQATETSVVLTRLDDDFTVINGSKKFNMPGYFEGTGPGLPHGDHLAAVLDAVIVFSLEE